MARVSAALPPRAGVGLKPEHARDIFAERPDLGFFEVHAENYMGAGGPPHRLLEAIRADYPLSLHGVGLSIGGAGPLDREHLRRLRDVIDRYEPGRFSEHLAWSSHGSEHLPDLLPMPLTEETLATVIAHIHQVQEALGISMLLENPSTYVGFAASSIPEVTFLEEVAARTGCGLLLDVNNVVVSAANHGFEARDYLARFPMDRVGEIHLAGHDEAVDEEGVAFLIDAHGSPTTDEVWTLYAETIARTGPLPTLIEWDNDLPTFDVLYEEARRAERILTTERRRRNRVEVQHVALV